MEPAHERGSCEDDGMNEARVGARGLPLLQCSDWSPHHRFGWRRAGSLILRSVLNASLFSRLGDNNGHK